MIFMELVKKSMALAKDDSLKNTFTYDGVDFRTLVARDIYKERHNPDINFIKMKYMLKWFIYTRIKGEKPKEEDTDIIIYDTTAKRRTKNSNYFGYLEDSLKDKSLRVEVFKPHQTFGTDLKDPVSYLEKSDFEKAKKARQKSNEKDPVMQLVKNYTYPLALLNYLAWKRVFEKTGAKAVILNAQSGIYAGTSIQAAKKLKRKAYVFPHSFLNKSALTRPEDRIDDPTLADRISTYGKKDIEMAKKNGYDTENMHPLGSIRHQNELENCRKPSAVRKQFGIREGDKAALYIAHGKLPGFKKVFEKLNFLRKKNNCKLIVKLHPDSNFPLWLKTMSCLDDNLIVTKKGNILEMINISNIIAGYCSTSLFESVWLGKPAVVFPFMTPLQEKFISNYCIGHGIYPCNELSELEKAFEIDMKEFEKQRKKMLEEVFMDPSEANIKASKIISRDLKE